MLTAEQFELCKEALKDCGHPDDQLVQMTNYFDGFNWYCKKCHKSFSRYDLMPFREYQELVEGGVE